MPALQRPTISAVVAQHVEDAASLRATRSVLLRAPHIDLFLLARHDERLHAHLDGALVAGEDGYRIAQGELESPGIGPAFVAAVLAIQRGDAAQIDRLLAQTAVSADVARGLASAFGWVSAHSLRGKTAPLLQSADPLRRWLGVAACAAHRVDPGSMLAAAMRDAHPGLRVAALRAAGQLGRIDLLDELLRCVDDPDPACRLAAASSAVLLGDRAGGLRALQELAMNKTSPSLPALQLSLLAVQPDTSRQIVRQLVADGASVRTTIRAAAWAGDAMVVPWLIKRMADDGCARLAAEAFCFLTGANLSLLGLERVGSGPPGGEPDDDPEDGNVTLDEDDSLPWPEPQAVHAWWQRNADSMPMGVRCVAGAPASATHCRNLLEAGTQRLRHAAALLSSLAQAGTVLFNVAAPAHRQRRMLAGHQAVA